MFISLVVVSTILFIYSLSISIYCYRLQKIMKTKQPDATAQHVLSELMAGPAVLRIEVIEKGSIMQWRSR